MRSVRRRSVGSFSTLLLSNSFAFAVAAFGQQSPAAQPPSGPGPADPPAAQELREAGAAEGEAKPDERPKFDIKDEPKTIDPARFEPLIPPKLAAKATVDFEGASLREVLAWLNDNGIPTLADDTGLEEAALTLDAPIDDRLTDEPVYFLLDRLASLDLDWYLDDGIVHLTSRDSAGDRMTTLSHNVGDLYDAGYDADTLIDLISSTIDPESWPEFGGTGNASVRSLGDVLFVSQTERNHRLVMGLLAALRTHGRMTYISEPPQHEILRTALVEKIVSAEYRGTRLEQAMNDLATQAGVTIRLDEIGLDEAAITRRSPVDLTLKQTRLSTTLGAILSDLDLAWILQGGAIVVTSSETAELETKVAVFDVRDLTIDQDEADSLMDAIVATLDPESWPEFGGHGNASIRMPVVGTLVVSQNERNLTELASLLERYREAIAKSKRREPRDAKDPSEVVTVYYRLPKAMADDLRLALPSMIEPETWSKEANDGKPGAVRAIASAPDAGLGSELAERSTLVVTHTRATHEKIEETLRRILRGDDPSLLFPGGFGGGGLGGGLPVDAMEGAPEVPAPSGGLGGGGGFGGGGFGGF